MAKHRRTGPIASIYLIPDINAKPGKHRRARKDRQISSTLANWLKVG